MSNPERGFTPDHKQLAPGENGFKKPFKNPERQAKLFAELEQLVEEAGK